MIHKKLIILIKHKEFPIFLQSVVFLVYALITLEIKIIILVVYLVIMLFEIRIKKKIAKKAIELAEKSSESFKDVRKDYKNLAELVNYHVPFDIKELIVKDLNSKKKVIEVNFRDKSET